ncbi:MAG: SCP2 sterol-binding domain-containing protein [Proteobacteria bacterium]|nr:SCP2 sterol-binding domain-containing protein [Pseudomonadota bacterium]
MAERGKGLAIRSFREGDEEAIAGLFNRYAKGFSGAASVTAESWREDVREQSWNGPPLDADRDCARLAERDGKVVGYALTDYQPYELKHAALVQELFVDDVEEAEEVAAALLEDAEKQARARDKECVMLLLSLEDGRAQRVAGASAFWEESDGTGVFMATILDLVAFLKEIEDELARRIAEGGLGGWEGTIRVVVGGQEATLRLRPGKLSVEEAAERADVAVSLAPEAGPPVLFGQMSVREAYAQGSLSVAAEDRAQGLRVVDALFPRRPMFLPRAQWW